MIDNRTHRLDLPKPNIDNYLEDDVQRLAEALDKLDEKVATIDGAGENSDIKQMTGLVGPLTLGADGEELLHAVTMRQFKEKTDYLYEAAPFPHVWVPLSDSLNMLAGVAPWDRITIGSQYVELPTKSITFSRATSATYIDKSGVLQTAAPNEPRFEKKGLLIEGDATNYYWHSNDPSSWFTSANYTRTVLQDGNTQAQTGNYKTNIETTDISILIDSNKNVVSLTAGEAVNISCRVKGAGCRLRVRVIDGSGAFAGDATLDLESLATTQNTGLTAVTRSDRDGDGYINFSCYFIAPSAGNFCFQLRGMPRVGQASIPVGAEISLQMPQLEKGRIKTSFIITGGSTATRTRDVWSMPALGNCGYRTLADKFKRTVALTITLDAHDFTAGPPSSYANVMQITGPTLDIPFRLSKNSAGDTYLTAYRSSAMSLTRKVTPSFEDAVCVYRVDGDDTTMGINGELSQRLGYLPTETVLPVSLITCNNVNSPAFVYHIRDLRIWHRALSDNQIKGLR